MRQDKYIGMDVHQASVSVAVLDGGGKLSMECVLETKASTIVEFIRGVRGSLAVTFEEGTCAAWLHDLLQPHVSRVVVCDPVDSRWVGGIAGVAGAHGELAEVGIVEETQGAGQQNFGPALSVSDNFLVGVGGGDEARVWMIFFCESAGSLVKMRERELDQLG